MEKFFAPGRTELAGNHTDHQKGRVLASAVDKGIHAEVEPNFDNIVRIRSEGFEDMEINLFDLDVHPEEFGSSTALVRGVASAMFDLDARFGGFNAVLHSDLSSGSGLSSSAAFAVLVARVFNGLYNNNELEPKAIAQLAQQAENLHFGKPCGMMDQLACALGKTVYVDFLTGDIQHNLQYCNKPYLGLNILKKLLKKSILQILQILHPKFQELLLRALKTLL